MTETSQTRRRFIATAAGLTLFSGLPALAIPDDQDTDVTPNEDLMREHGALNRLLLIYDESAKRVRANAGIDVNALRGAAALMQTFVEGYHERLEEEFVFPPLKKAGKLASLVDVLLEQHAAGRKVTRTVLELATIAAVKDGPAREKLADALASFVRMYRPHEAREDTVVFPAFKSAFSRKDYRALGEKFEDREKEMFGPNGFESVLGRIDEIEIALGIHDLSQFTPS